MEQYMDAWQLRERERLNMTEYAGLGPIESLSLDHQ